MLSVRTCPKFKQNRGQFTHITCNIPAGTNSPAKTKTRLGKLPQGAVVIEPSFRAKTFWLTAEDSFISADCKMVPNDDRASWNSIPFVAVFGLRRMRNPTDDHWPPSKSLASCIDSEIQDALAPTGDKNCGVKKGETYQ